MPLRADEGPPASVGPADGGADQPKGRKKGGARVPNVKGDFDELLSDRPVFRTKLNGYDRLEVDNYTLWAEGELVALRRQLDHLLNRFGSASAELEISRRLLADAPRGHDVFPVSDRVTEILRLASDEAAAITEAATRDAESVLAEARTEADARLRKAHEIKEMAVSAADDILEHARRDRAAAAAALEQARAEAGEIVRQGVLERDRLAAEGARQRDELIAEATAHLAEVRTAVDQLRGQRDRARESLRGLTDRIGEALAAVADMAPEDLPRTHVVRGNVAMEEPPADEVSEPGVVVAMVGRPAVASS
jgi:cell division septum initiation protein DivIVA